MKRKGPRHRTKRPPEPTPPALPLNIPAGLEPYTAPLTRLEAAHLLRRTSFGARAELVNRLVGSDATLAAQGLLDAALSAPPLPEPDWLTTKPPNEDSSDQVFEAFFDINEQWVDELMRSVVSGMRQGGLADRMTLFWLNHFVTGYESYELASFSYSYLQLLRTNSLGNFKDFTRAVGVEPAMLFYLDGFVNEKDAPNENYARELMELFTTGIQDPAGNPNYTERDIAEMARALTGWTVEWEQLVVYFDDELHDFGSKSFLGRTGTFGYDDVVDILFEERGQAIAHHICRKLYRDFVYNTPDDAIVSELADLFVASGFEIAPVVQALLASAHFFDRQIIGARLKGPIEHLVGLSVEYPVSPDEELLDDLHYGAADLGQALLEPPNVAGWPGHRTWLDTTTLPKRWDMAGYLLYHGEDQGGDGLVLELARQLHNANHAEAAFRLPVALAQHFLAVPLAEAAILDPGGGFGGNLAQNPIPAGVLSAPLHEQDLAKRFLDGQPWYEWSLARPEAPGLIRQYLEYIVRLPEFQLT